MKKFSWLFLHFSFPGEDQAQNLKGSFNARIQDWRINVACVSGDHVLIGIIKSDNGLQYFAWHQVLHLEKIERLELIDRLMWQEYQKETQPYSKVKILETIANAQANVSSYYETSIIALEVSAKFNGHDNNKKNDYGPISFEDWTKNNIQPRIGDDS